LDGNLTNLKIFDKKIKLKAFWTVWTGFLATKISLDEGHKTAWMTLGQDFAKAANKHLKLLGLPTAE